MVSRRHGEKVSKHSLRNGQDEPQAHARRDSDNWRGERYSGSKAERGTASQKERHIHLMTPYGLLVYEQYFFIIQCFI